MYNHHIVSQDSFHGAKGWVKELKRRGDPNVVIALAGNKADLHTKRKVDAEVGQCLAHPVCSKYCNRTTPCVVWHPATHTQTAEEYAGEQSIIYMDTSAKTAMNVKELFVEIGTSALAPVCPLSARFCSPRPTCHLSAKRLPKNQKSETADAFPISADPEPRKKSCCS